MAKSKTGTKPSRRINRPTQTYLKKIPPYQVGSCKDEPEVVTIHPDLIHEVKKDIEALNSQISSICCSINLQTTIEEMSIIRNQLAELIRLKLDLIKLVSNSLSEE